MDKLSLNIFVEETFINIYSYQGRLLYIVFAHTHSLARRTGSFASGKALKSHQSLKALRELLAVHDLFTRRLVNRINFEQSFDYYISNYPLKKS